MRLGIFILTLSLLFSLGKANAVSESERDQQRYGHIARFKEIESEDQQTYEDYIRENPVIPIVSQRLVLQNGKLVAPEEADGFPLEQSTADPKALLIVNTTLRPQIATRFTRYITDLQAQGFNVVVVESEGGTPEDLKALIISHQTDLVGVVLVGEQPASWFEIDESGFPCDMFFMDLDGTWIDADGDDQYDDHEDGTGDEGPEICVARIAAHNIGGGTEVGMLDHYFDKNHDYRTGVIRAAEKGLTYVEQDWAGWAEANFGIGRAYPNFDNFTPPDLSEPDYLDRISNDLYEFVQLCAHSNSGGHSVGGGWVTTSEIQNAPPIAVFYNLFACGSGNFTVYNWVAGGYVYNTTGQGITCIACSRSGSMTNFYEFYGPFGEGETFGESFRLYMEFLAPYTEGDRSWQFGLNIQGDPFAVEDPILPFRLYAPVGGEEWLREHSFTIEWTHTAVAGADIKIELLRNGSFHSYITENTPNDNEFEWNIPSDLIPGTNYQVQITSISNPVYTDTSPNYFAITATEWDHLSDDPCYWPYDDTVTPPEEPRLRTNVAGISDGEKFYVIAGNGSDYTDSNDEKYWGNRQSTFSVFDPGSMTWSGARYDYDHPIGYNNGNGTAKPVCGNGTGSVHMAAVAYDLDYDGTKELITFGGYPIWGGNGIIYDPDDDSWSKTPDKPAHSGGGYQACSDGMHAIIGSVYYQYGGGFNGPDASTFYTYDFDTLIWTEMPSGPITMTSGTGAAVGGKFYLISGSQDGTNRSTDCWAYDPSTGLWSQIADIPTGVNKAPAVVLDDKIFIMGGSVGSDIDTIQIYDPALDSWSVSPITLPIPWSSQGVAYVDGYVYLADGSSGGMTNVSYRISVAHFIEGADTDEDGLPDNWELLYFGDLSHGPDDDEEPDGLTNIEELNHGTNPIDANTDGDGVNDGDEVDAGTNPLVFTYYVDNENGSDTYDGLTPAWDGVNGPKKTVQAGLDVAAAENEVIVATGTYTGTENKELDFGSKAILLRSWNGPEETIIDCEGSGRGFNFNDAEGTDSFVDGFTVTNGNAIDFGGGIYCDTSSPTIRNCIIKDCYAGIGGGGVCIRSGNGMTITNFLVEGNSSGNKGGGIFCVSTTALFLNSTISDNSASVEGGGITCGSNSIVTMTNSILWNNSAPYGHEIRLKSETDPSTLILTYSDSQDGTSGAYLGSGCVLNLGDGTIDSDPLFAAGPLGNYYLSQIAAGQASDSPCVDTGSDTAVNIGLDTSTTRTDNDFDAGTVDMGYHYTATIEISITSIERDADDITIEWDAQADVSYTVQWSTDMENWNDVPVGETGTWTDIGVLEMLKYYRVTDQ